MKNKMIDIKQAISGIGDGATIMVGGFGSPGTPFTLIDALVEYGSKNLTLIKNDANEAHIGISKLLESGQVSRLITSHLGLNRHAIEKMKNEEIDVEFVPQGMLAERIRCEGVGLPAFLSKIGLDTEITVPKSLTTIDGEVYKVERAIQADFALIHAEVADRYGNLRYNATAMNFNPLMAMAAKQVIVETANCSEDALSPDAIHTPGIFVDQLCVMTNLSERYQLMEHHIHA